MDGVRRVARTARARLVRQRLVDTGGRWLVAGAGVGLGLVALGKCVSVPWMEPGGLHWSAWLLGPVLLGGVATLVRATHGRPSELAATHTIDRALGLKDRLSASLTLDATSGAGRDDPFAQMLHRDAEDAARGADVARAVPLRWTRLWAAWPALVVAGGVVGAVVPPLTPAARQLEERRATREREQRAAAAEVAQAVREIERVLPTGLDGESREAVAELEAIEKELAAKKLEPEAARQTAASALEDAAKRLESQGELAVRERERVRDALAEAARKASLSERVQADATASEGASTQETAGAGPADGKERRKDDSALVRALRSGDFAAAKQAADELMNASRSGAAPAEAAQLDQLAKDLEAIQRKRDEAERARREADRRSADAAKPDPPGREAEQPKTEPTNASSGSESRSSEPNDNTSPKQPDGDTAARSQGAREAQEPAGERNSPGKLAEALRDAARELREREQKQGAEQRSSSPSEKDASPEQKQDKAQGGESDRQEPAKSGSESQSSPRAEGQSSTDRSERSDSRTSDTASEQGRRTEGKDQRQRSSPSGESGGTRQESGERARDESEQKQQTSREGGRTSTPESAGTQERTGQRVPDSGKTSGDKQPDADRTAEGRSSETPREHESRPSASDPGQKPDGQQPDLPKPSPDAVKRLAEELDRIARAPQDAGQKQRDADALRKKAQEMLERSSPEQRERLRQWGEAVAREREKRGEPSQKQDAQRQPGELPSEQSQSAQGEGERGGQRETPNAAQSRSDANPESSRAMPRSAPQGTSAMPSGGNQAGTQPGATNGRSEAKVPEQSRTEIVDARRSTSPGEPEAPGSVAAEWLGQGSRTPASDAALARTLAQAAKSAERAIDDQTVPRRFDRVVERYFRRLPAAVRPSAESEAPPAAPAKDAP